MSKLYIAVLDGVPDHMVPCVVAHAVLGAHLQFDGVNEFYDDWLAHSFRKVILKVNQKEFNKILSEADDWHSCHENSVCEGRECCIVVAPQAEYPNVLKFAKMWKPNE